MERRAKPRKVYQSASYLTSNAVFYGTLLFLISRFFSFIKLFVDAASRKQQKVAPPESFTFLNIFWTIVVLAVIGGAFVLLLRARQKKTRLKKGNLFLLLNTLFAVWGAIQAISGLLEGNLLFELVDILDLLTLLAGLVLPSVLLQLADRRQEMPQDTVLLCAGIGTTAFSIIAALIVALFMHTSYPTVFPLVLELMYRGGIILFGVAGLQKALKLRAEPPPAYTPKPAAPKKAETVKREPKKTVVQPDKNGKIECPDCGKKMPAGTANCPRCGFDMSTPSLFDDDEPEDAPEPEEEAQAAEEAPYDEPQDEESAPEPEPVKSDLCPRCGKKIPEPLTTCPRCGYYPGDPLEMPKEPEKKPAEPKPRADEPRRERLCAKCGRKIPGNLATCPYCGYHPSDEELAAEEAAAEHEEAEEPSDGVPCPRCDRMVRHGTRICPHCGYPFPDETSRFARPATRRLPRVPDPRRLTEKNSIECPDCGRRYSAARDVCPYCGYHLYED